MFDKDFTALEGRKPAGMAGGRSMGRVILDRFIGK